MPVSFTLGVMLIPGPTMPPLDAAYEYLAELRAKLPVELRKDSLTQYSKIPFKASSLHGLLGHRTWHLGTAALMLFQQNHRLAGIIVTRSILETVAVAYALQRRIQKYLHSASDQSLDSYLMKLLIASGAPDAKHPAMNISGLVNSLDKRITGFKTSYNELSEFVHPNWSGTLGSFGSIDESTDALFYGASNDPVDDGVGLGALAGSVGVFSEIYSELIPLLVDLNSRFTSSKE